MPWKCPQCGVTSADDKRTCEACGFVEFGVLTLVSVETGKDAKFNIDTAVGRALLGRFAGDEARFASEPQFQLRRDAAVGAWVALAGSGATNPTCYNGNPLTDAPQKLEEGGVLSIGPEKMKLTVRLTT